MNCYGTNKDQLDNITRTEQQSFEGWPSTCKESKCQNIFLLQCIWHGYVNRVILQHQIGYPRLKYFDKFCADKTAHWVSRKREFRYTGPVWRVQGHSYNKEKRRTSHFITVNKYWVYFIDSRILLRLQYSFVNLHKNVTLLCD